MRFVSLALAVSLAFLAGCSSLPRDSGFEVRKVEAIGRQEPWQNRAISRDVFRPEGVALVYVRLPEPLPEKWKKEFVDPHRTYEVQEGRRKVPKPLVREVFRAVAIYGPGNAKIYDAIVDQGVKGFRVLVPVSDMRHIEGKSLYILSSDGKWGMTTLGSLLEFEKGFAPDRVPAEPSSRVTQVVHLQPGANEHALRALLGIAHSFPQPFWLRGKDEAYLGKPDIVTVLTEFTSVEGVPDRLISCTSLKLGPGTAAALPIVAALYGYQAVSALAKEDCLKPLDFPAAPHKGASDMSREDL